MSVHPNGDGEAWVEDVDVDQPHGLDYRYENHIAKAMRLRTEKEHKAFGDTTAGGEHVPGRVQHLAFEDGTSDVTQPFSDGSYNSHCQVWDTSSRVWCITGDDSYTGETPKVVKTHPDKQWEGGDVTWQGAHEFDASVDFTGAISFDGTADFGEVDGSISIGDTLRFDGGTSQILIADDSLTIDNETVDKGVRVDCTWTFTKAVDFTASSVIMNGNMNITGAGGAPGALGNLRITSDGELDFSEGTMILDATSTMSVCGDVSASGGGNWSILGDWSSVGYAVNTTYGPTPTDGFVVGYAQNTTNLSMYTDSNAAPVTKRWLSNGASGKRSNFMCPVREGDFWCLSHGSGAGDTAIGDGTIAWIPIGANA